MKYINASAVNPLLEDTDKFAYKLRDRLGIEEGWLRRWSTLSHGERKRAQIGTALWLQPGVLAVDEPTNHLDSNARDMQAKALRSFKGVGLLVSHDRPFLDRLTHSRRHIAEKPLTYGDFQLKMVN